MQIDRLIQIVFLLLSHEHMTARQLAAELQVSTRTIYRDINTLSIAGIPVTSQKGYGGGLSLLPGFSIDKSYFTKEEQTHIIQALQILKSARYPDAARSLSKVAGLFSHNLQSEWLDIDFSYWGSPEKERMDLSALERAIISKYVITFTYCNTSLEVTLQTVEPLKLVFKLRFSEKIAYKVYDEFQEKDITRLEDGKLEVTFRYQLTDWTFLYLLSFGEYAEIIEPAEARTILKEKAVKIASMY